MTISVIGANWIRAALQVNPFAYKGTNQPSTAFDSEEDYNKILLDECGSLGVSLIAITDHWTVETAAGLIADATDRGITALPGFEANTSEGVHLLVIFEAGTELSAINAAIGACGVEPGCANGTTGKPFGELLEEMTDRGALVIPAHVNVANGGMLTGRTGQPLVEMVTNTQLHAVAVVPSQEDGTDQQKIEKGQKPYDRRHPLSVIHADDVVHPDQLTSVGATTWFKVSNPSVESLKLAVRTPETRVSHDDPAGVPRALLRSISWTGGFLDGVAIPISGDLTALIGGRGTGKSTVIESLRYALDVDPIGEDATRDHESVINNVVRSGTIIKVEVDTVSPTPQHFTIERVVPDPPLVRDAGGSATSLRPLDVAGLVEVFGQHELAELANDPARVAEMIQRFAGTTGADSSHQDVLDKLAANRGSLKNAEEARELLEAELADIPRLDEQVKQFTETDVATRLEDLKRLERDESVFTEATERVTAAKQAVTDLADPQLEAMLVTAYDGLEESPQASELQGAVAATSKLAATLATLASDASTAVADAESDLAVAKEQWEASVKSQRDGHAEVLRNLHEDGLEPDKYLATTKALDELTAKQPRLAVHNATIQGLITERGELLGDLATLENTQREALHDAVREANIATDGVVIVRPVAASDRQHILDAIARHLMGQRGQITAAVNAEDFSPRSLAAAVRGGADDLSELGIRGAQSANLIAAGEPLTRELEELTVGHAVEVLLNVSTGGATELKKMDELSKGQRATALLLLLLGASTAPLVIDQPEDDLDNRFVYDGVVQHLRKLKGVRQILVSTHNANVPVLGDAELIVALEGNGQHGKPVEDGIGSLDDAAIRSIAEQLLEGGAEAFNARQHLYGF